MSNSMLPSSAPARAADTLMSNCGGRQVLLRMPAPAIAGDVTEQLGIATPRFQDIPLAPVVFRKARAVINATKPAKWELVVSATAVEAVVTSLGYSSASVLFKDTAGVLIDDELLEILSATEEQVFGAPYAYRLLVYAPLAQKN